MTHGKYSSLNSVVVSVMLSESRVFRCHELPEWQRWGWLLWSLLPAFVFWIGDQPRRLAVVLVSDWRAGWQCILSPLVPVGMAAG